MQKLSTFEQRGRSMATKKVTAPKDRTVDEKKRTRVMPDFAVRRGEGWRDPEFITAEDRRRMLAALSQSPLSRSQQLQLVQFCNDHLQSSKPFVAGDIQRKQILAIAQDARRLLDRIQNLCEPAIEEVKIRTYELSHVSAPPVLLDFGVIKILKEPRQSILKSSWTWINALEECCEYAASKMQIDRQSKPETLRARRAVALVARQVLSCTGELPPVAGKSWFAIFMWIVGQRVLKLEIGQRIIASGVKMVSSR